MVTLHRPANVDQPERLARLVALLVETARRLPLVFPVHPRTRSRLAALGLDESGAARDLRLAPPLGYLEFLGLLDGARLALSDSGGVQEETTALGIPCLTLRDNTERPVTVTEGTNTLVGADGQHLGEALERALRRPAEARHESPRPSLWDGHAAERVVAELLRAA